MTLEQDQTLTGQWEAAPQSHMVYALHRLTESKGELEADFLVRSKTESQSDAALVGERGGGGCSWDPGDGCIVGPGGLLAVRRRGSKQPSVTAVGVLGEGL